MGLLKRLFWHESQRWVKVQVVPQDLCDEYMRCGANTICNEDTLAHCACLPGFERLYPQDWYLKWYGNVYVDEMGQGCIAWYGELQDIRHFKRGQDFYLTVNAVELDIGSRKDYFSDRIDLITITFVSNDNEVYIKSSPKKGSVFSRIVLESMGLLKRKIWHESQRWVRVQIVLHDLCDEYMRCGANAICNEDMLAHCACLPGFERLYPQDWYLKCQETRKEACGKGDGEGFVRLEGVKFPDARNATLYSNMSLEECERECLRSCNCTGYANVYVDEMGRGCIAWYSELRDMRRFKSGQDFYLRVNAVELALDAQKNARVHIIATKSTLVFIIVPLVVETLLAALCFYYFWRRNAKRNKGDSKDSYITIHLNLLRAEAETTASSKQVSFGFGKKFAS
ncbi:hypothetical protein Q3G72_030521 [Acer saccharum]|nr:hypothetical protein Q3G72_030521 [Acer saccharum]